jgi:hypothetical protein
MAAKFVLNDAEQVRTCIAPIATGTAIEYGDLVAMTSGLIVKAAAASTAIAYCTKAHPANSGTQIEVTVGNDFTLLGTANAVFAAAHRGTEVDIVDTTQLINVGASSTDVLKVSICENTGVIGSANNVEVRINKPLF